MTKRITFGKHRGMTVDSFLTIVLDSYIQWLHCEATSGRGRTDMQELSPYVNTMQSPHIHTWDGGGASCDRSKLVQPRT